LADFLEYIPGNITWNEGLIMRNRMNNADTVFAARAAEGARVILYAVIGAESGFKNRSWISSEQR